jgi:hypothetical protein
MTDPTIAAPLPPAGAAGTAVLEPEPTGANPRRITLDPAYLLTVDATGEIALPGLGVQVDDVGLSVVKDDGALAALLPWDELNDLSATGRTTLADGSQAVVVEATTRLNTHRFVVPSADPAGLEAAVAEFRQTGEGPGRKRRLSPLLGVLFVLLAAAVVVLVLAAMGAIKV